MQAEAEVQILAQGGSKPLEELSGHQHISIHTIKDACVSCTLELRH